MTATLAAPAPVRRLRDYQTEAIERVDAEWAAGRTRTAVVLATGLGKTDVIAYAATRAAADLDDDRGPVLVLAHRDELLNQITERCLMHRPDLPVGRVQGAQNQHRTPIVVASSSTLGGKRGARRRQMMRRPRLVIVDETHHAVSDGYLAILRWAGCLDEPTATSAPTPLLGVTATLVRGDKRQLGGVFHSVAVERGTVWAIEHGPADDDPAVTARVGEGASRGWLVRPHAKVVVGEHVDLGQARTSAGDWKADDVGEMVAQDVEHIVEAWQEYAQLPDGSPRLTIAFTPNKASAAALAEAFRAAGIPVGEVYGDTAHAVRNRLYGDLAAGRVHVLVSVMVMTEGWDCPPVSCVLNARPTKLPGLYTQMVGRGLRPSPATGKTDCLVLDVVGAAKTAKLITLAELHPGAVIDQVEREIVPCEQCGGYTCKRSAAVAVAVERGMVACSCPCPDGCGETVLGCVCDLGGGRDPDGGRRRLRGRAVYAEVDLLALDPEEPAGSLNWLTSDQGDLFVSIGNRFVVLSEGAGGAWSAAAIRQTGDRRPELICDGLSLPSAKVMVQRWVDGQAEAGAKVYARNAAWRVSRAAPSEGQIRQAHRLGIADPEGYTKGALSDAMDVVRASRQLAPTPKPAATWQEAHALAGGGR